ncbi:MAG TPA: hypothetical protein PKI20_20220 [Verrucomicrobiota bacterium]|nr:hypothetical protein [Verrucomicrobiota bacterium]
MKTKSHPSCSTLSACVALLAAVALCTTIAHAPAQGAVDLDAELLTAQVVILPQRRVAGGGLGGADPAQALGFGQGPAPGIGAGAEDGAGAALGRGFGIVRHGQGAAALAEG